MSDFLIIDGVIAAQTPGVVDAFKKIINDFECIIEIGSNRGAFTKCLLDNKADYTILYSIDINLDLFLFNKNEFNLFQFDCFSDIGVSTIKDIIKNNKRVLLLCDGGNKNLEFNTFSAFLKSDDVIMLHDYCDDDNEFNYLKSLIKWEAPAESSYANIEQSIILYNLNKYHYDEFKSLLWGAFIKN